MSNRLLSAFAAHDPERFAELLGTSDDVSSTIDILTDIPDGMECDLVARLKPEAAGRLLSEVADEALVAWLESASLDSGRRLLSRISSERSARLVENVSNRSKRRGLRRLVSYPAGSIGELVQTRIPVIKETTPAVDIGKEIRRQSGLPGGLIAIERTDGTFKGVLDLVRFVQNENTEATAADFCTPVRPVYPDSPQSLFSNPSEWRGLTSLPVVDPEGRPIGQVTREALENIAGTADVDDPVLDSIIELSKKFWEVSSELLVFVLGRRVER